MNAVGRPVTVLIGMAGLRLGADIDEEIQIGRTTFVSARRLQRVRRRVGLPITLAELRRRSPFAADILDAAPTVAVVRNSRSTEEADYAEEYRHVRESTWLLAASLLGSLDRSRAHFGVMRHGDRPVQNLVSIDARSTHATVSGAVTASGMPWVFAGRWRETAMEGGYFSLLNMAARKGTGEQGWGESIRRALMFAGQSQLSTTRQEAFMKTMIGIETLVARQGDRFPDVLIERLEAFFGWIRPGAREGLEESIRRAYRLRCAFVHDAKSEDVTGGDLFFADTILRNLFRNIGRNPKYFASKGRLIDFTEEVSARARLRQKRWRKKPQLSFLSLARNEKQLREWGNDIRWG